MTINQWVRSGSIGAGAGIGVCMLFDLLLWHPPHPTPDETKEQLQIRLHFVEQQLVRCQRVIDAGTQR